MPSMLRLTAIFLRVGILTFGGGDPTMAALYSELVANRRWLSNETYGLVYGLARITPGTNLLAFCAGSAWTLFGWIGAFAAVLAVVLPSAAAVFFLTRGYEALGTNASAIAAIAGTLAAAVGMMAAGAWQLLRPHLNPGRWFRAAVIFSGSLLLSLAASTPPIQVLALATAIGLLWRVPAEK